MTRVQGFIASGQVRNLGQLLNAQPGTVLLILEPLYEGWLAGVLPGSKIRANAYTSNHEELQRPDIVSGRAPVLPAMLPRFQALLMHFNQLVFAGGPSG